MKHKPSLSTLFKLSAVAATLAVTGCSDDNDDVTETVTEGEIHGPFSTGSITESNFVYFDLDTASVVELTEEQAAEDTQWDIAFKRTSVILNSHSDAMVSVYDTGNNSDFWDDEGAAVVDTFVNATPETELDDYLAVGFADIPADEAEFSNDTTEKALDGFYNYDFTTHQVSAAPESYFVVKSGDVYSKFSVTSLTQEGFAATDMTLSVAYDFSDAQEIQLNAAADCDDSGYAHVDFASLSAVSADATYDIMVPCVDGGFDFALDLAADATAYQDSANMIADADTAAIYSSYGYCKENEYTVAAFDALNWYAYGIQGNHLLWSKYGVYIIKAGDNYHKLQITSYYDEEGNSGNYSFRADQLVSE